jgi:DNA-directed RNA polymerase alpha subunit
VFGLGLNEKTYREISALEGVSEERIWQVVSKAKRKIEYALYLASQRMSDPHVVVKEVTNKDRTPNLPSRPKWLFDLGPLSARTWNCLKAADLLLLDRLLQKHDFELLKEPHFGRKSLLEVKSLLAQFGLSLKTQSDHYVLMRAKDTE